MRFPRRTYSAITNTCLILGVVSALGFDRAEHMAWLVLGGCAAIGAITTYFAQHWQTQSGNESTSLASLPTHPQAVDLGESVELWTTLMRPSIVSTRLASTERAPQGSYRTLGGWRPAESLSFSSFHMVFKPHVVSKPPDPAELVSGLIKKLQATYKPNAYALVIAKDGSITLRFEDNVEQPETSGLSQSIVAQLPETIH